MPPEPEGAFQLLNLHTLSFVQAPVHPGLSAFLLLMLIFISAFFSASEAAIITVNDNKIKKMAEDGNPRAKKIVKLTANSSRFLSMIQTGLTLSGFLLSACTAIFFGKPLANILSEAFAWRMSASLIVSILLLTFLLSFLSLVLGKLVPRKIAVQRAELFAFRFIGFLCCIQKLLHPFLILISTFANGVIRLFGFDPSASEETVTEEEILMMVDVGEEKGVIDESAKDMIANIFDFDDTTADEVMTHRTDMTAAEDTDSLQTAIGLAIENGYSRIPVYHEDLDNIIGILYVKDVLKYVGTTLPDSLKITDIMRPAYFVPESKRCSELLTEMTERRLQIAIVVDEYGGTEGLISMEDLLESIVGNIQDEYDNEEEEIRKVSDNTFTVEGTTSIDEISDLLDEELPEGDYDTIAGLVVEMLGRIPSSNEHPSVSLGNLTFTVQKVEDRRIAKLLIVKEKSSGKSSSEPKE